MISSRSKCGRSSRYGSTGVSRSIASPTRAPAARTSLGQPHRVRGRLGVEGHVVGARLGVRDRRPLRARRSSGGSRTASWSPRAARRTSARPIVSLGTNRLSMMSTCSQSAVVVDPLGGLDGEVGREQAGGDEERTVGHRVSVRTTAARVRARIGSIARRIRPGEERSPLDTVRGSASIDDCRRWWRRRTRPPRSPMPSLPARRRTRRALLAALTAALRHARRRARRAHPAGRPGG